jgi:hypothetical protein
MAIARQRLHCCVSSQTHQLLAIFRKKYGFRTSGAIEKIIYSYLSPSDETRSDSHVLNCPDDPRQPLSTLEKRLTLAEAQINFLAQSPYLHTGSLSSCDRNVPDRSLSRYIICKQITRPSNSTPTSRYWHGFKIGFVEQLDKAASYEFMNVIRTINRILADDNHKPRYGETIKYKRLDEVAQTVLNT